MARNGGSTNGPGAGYLELLETIEPGDAVEVWLESTYLVRTLYVCRERLDQHATEWRWFFLDDGSLIEASPDGYYRYRTHDVLRQGSALYEELVAQDGALVRFEARVREGTSARRPVHVTVDGVEYRVASTGTAAMERRGDEPDLLPWKSISSDPSGNIYFGLVNTEDEDQAILGLWTAHICLSKGGPLLETAISGVYQQPRK